MVENPRVAIVVVNWRQPELTLACLESLSRVDYPSYSVVLVDNGSADGSPALIRQRFPRVAVVETGANLGFAGGNNAGMELALREGADYVLLLNNDTEVAPDFLGKLVAVGESDPAIGMVGPKILYFDPSNVIWCAGGRVDQLGQPGHLGADQVDDGRADAVRDVDYASGCALLVKRSVVEKIGGLDCRFFMYFEETEWCTRARRHGFRVLYVPQARIWHKISPTARGHSRRYLYLMARNRLLYLRCSGARPWLVAGAALQLLRTSVSWYVRPRHREMRPYSSALLRGVAHYAVGRFGAPPLRP